MRKTGNYQKLGELNYFTPLPLPPSNPSLTLDANLMSLYGEASFALGRLNEMSARLPDPKRFIKAYVIKEALLSSAIEGIHTSIIDILSYSQTDKKNNKDTQLVLNYQKALDEALDMIQKQELPIVTRVLLKTHKTLLSQGDGDSSMPGQFRLHPVRVGDLTPPPAPAIPQLITDLEKYVNNSNDMPALIKAGLAHVQFETIHPFADGNGRMGRLLIIMMLVQSNLLSLPVLYPSYYFKKHHLEYYQKLDRVKTGGDFEGWVTYYLQAIRDSAVDAYMRAKDIEKLEMDLKQVIASDKSFAKMRDTALAALNYLFAKPITRITEMSKDLSKAYNTIHNILALFIKLGIVTEKANIKQGKNYQFTAYISLLEKEY